MRSKRRAREERRGRTCRTGRSLGRFARFQGPLRVLLARLKRPTSPANKQQKTALRSERARKSMALARCAAQRRSRRWCDQTSSFKSSRLGRWQRARRRCARSTCRAARKESDENGAVGEENDHAPAGRPSHSDLIAPSSRQLPTGSLTAVALNFHLFLRSPALLSSPRPYIHWIEHLEESLN